LAFRPQEGNWTFAGEGQESRGVYTSFSFEGSGEWDVSGSGSSDSSGSNEDYSWESHVETESFSRGSVSESGMEKT